MPNVECRMSETLRSVAPYAWVLLLSFAAAGPAGAQQRPLVTEDPETIGSGNILIEAGFDYARDALYPVSGLEGNLLRFPSVGTSFGLGSIVELQVDWAPYQRLAVTDRFVAPLSSLVDFDGDTTSDVDDMVVATKVRFLSEAPGRPALGFRLATKLPLASNQSGLGLDTTDFNASVLVGKTIQSIRLVGNIGFGILEDPVRGDRQNDALTYGFSVARAIAQGFEVVGEINGRDQKWGDDPPEGTESRSILRFGARFTRGSARVDGGLLVGLVSTDPSWGFTAGVTWVFRGFTVP
jgi:hypothetical protein